ncbi:MAG: isochorismatase family protein [Nitriliruptorales bacterium]|nr:isochorismatase family protein [Nitriliruptorales bacterium]
MHAPRPFEEKVAPHRTAVVVVDYQHDFVSPGGALDRAGLFHPNLGEIAPTVAAVADAGRAAGCLVVFVRCHFDRERYLSEAFLEQAARRYRGLYVDLPVCVAGTLGAEFAGGLAPTERDVVVTKHRFSAFEGTDLDLVLRTHDIRTLVVMGVVTHVCVESTVRDAFFSDYSPVVLEDAVAGWQPDWHRTSLEVMDWGFAEVVSASRLLVAWEGADRTAVSSGS